MNQESNSNLTALEKYLEEVQKTRFFQGEEVGGSFAQAREFHGKRAGFRRTAFRRWGMLVVILSATLPVVAAFSDMLPAGTLLVSLMAAAIAILTSANSFFHWDTGWQGSTNVQMGIDQLYDNWQFAIANARTNTNGSDGLEQARKATQEFVDAVHELIEAEAREYLSRQRFPETQK
jgi:uncharacterized protein DUF4231